LSPGLRGATSRGALTGVSLDQRATERKGGPTEATERPRRIHGQALLEDRLHDHDPQRRCPPRQRPHPLGIDEAIRTGPCNGTVEHISSDEITAQQMALEALAQGSDPEFFDLDEDGKPVES
jgi:hypothetical protein